MSNSIHRHLLPEIFLNPPADEGSAAPMGFSKLPPEILLHIFRFLTVEDCRMSASVCKLWKEVSQSNEIVFQRIQAPGLSLNDFTGIPLHETLGRMVPWEVALKSKKPVLNRCVAVAEKIFCMKSIIKGTVTDNRYLYVLTEQKVKEKYQNVFSRILHGVGNIESYSLPSPSSLSCLQKIEENFYCCSAETKEVFKFSFGDKGITIFQTSVLQFDFKKIQMIDENKILILTDSFAMHKERLILHDLIDKDIPDESFEMPGDTVDFQYSADGSIWSLHKRIAYARAYRDRNKLLGTTLCRTYRDARPQEETSFWQYYGNFTSSQPDTLTFWGKHGCGVLSGEEPSKDCILDAKKSLTFFGVEFHRRPISSRSIFSGGVGETTVVATNKKISFYDSEKQKIVSIKTKRPIISDLYLKKNFNSLKNNCVTDSFHPKYKRVLQTFENALFFYSIGERSIYRHSLRKG